MLLQDNTNGNFYGGEYIISTNHTLTGAALSDNLYRTALNFDEKPNNLFTQYILDILIKKITDFLIFISKMDHFFMDHDFRISQFMGRQLICIYRTIKWLFFIVIKRFGFEI